MTKKIIVGIISSKGNGYDNFKNIWLENINIFNQKYPDIASNYIFYFLYSEKQETCINQISKIGNNIFDYMYGYNYDYVRMKCIYLKNMSFFKSIINLDFDYILRTNLSTLFNFQKFYNWMQKMPVNNFFGGTIIGEYQEKNTLFSGTNLVISRDLIKYLIQQPLPKELGKNEDDILISKCLMAYGSRYYNLNMINIPRLDLVEFNVRGKSGEVKMQKLLSFEKCNKMYLEDIFCIRFKTNDRNDDIVNMKYFLENLYCNLNLDILKVYENYLHVAFFPEYYKFFSLKPFTLSETLIL